MPALPSYWNNIAVMRSASRHPAQAGGVSSRKRQPRLQDAAQRRPPTLRLRTGNRLLQARRSPTRYMI